LVFASCWRSRGEPAAPAVFADRGSVGCEGDTFLGGSELRRFRIVKMIAEWDPDAAFHAAWVVELA